MDENARREDARRTIRTVSLGAMLRLLRWPFVLLSMVFIPRIMQDQVYGRYALFSSVYIMADMFSDIGILQIMGRFVPGQETPDLDRRRRLLLQGLLVAGLLLALLACLAVIVFVGLFSFEDFPSEWLFPFCLLMIVTRVEGVLYAFLYGMNHIARYSSRDVMRSLLSFAAVLVFFLRYGLQGALWSLVVREGVLGVIALRWTWRFLYPRVSFGWLDLKPYVLFGVSFYVPLMLFGFVQWSGPMFIQAIAKSPEHVGYFDVANQFLMLSVSFLGLILMTLLPSMSAYREADDHAIIHRWHGNIMGYCGVVVFMIFNALVWLGEPVLALCLGPDFAPVRNLALIMVLAMIPGLIVYVGMNYTLLAKEPAVYTRGVVAGIAVMTLVSLALIPRLVSAGAAWASVSAHAVLAAFFCYRYREDFRHVLSGYFKAILLGVLFIPMLWVKVRLPWAVMGFVAASLLYLALVLAAGFLDLALLRKYAIKGWAFARRGCHD